MNGRTENDLRIDGKINAILRDMPMFVKKWHQYLKVNGKEASTRKDYVTKVARFIREMHIETPDDITEDVVMAFWADNLSVNHKTGEESGYSFKFTNWVVLKNFFVYLQERELIKNIVHVSIDSKISLAGIRCPSKKTSQKPSKKVTLTEDDFSAICQRADENPNEILAIRDRAIMLLFMTTGMRETALVNLDVEDLNIETKELHFIDKRRKDFYRQLNDATFDAVYMWLTFYRNEYATRSAKPTNALFLSLNGNRMIAKDIIYLIKKYSKEGIGVQLSPHKIRHGFGTILYEKTMDLKFVAEVMGHEDVATTARHYVITSNDKVKQAGNLLDII